MFTETVMTLKKWNQLSRQDFVELNKTMNGIEIAEKYRVHPNSVYYRLQMFGLNKPRRNRAFNPPKEELQNLYGRMSMLDIAKHYGVGETVVFKRIKQYDLPYISRSDRLSGKPKSLAHRLAMSASARESGVRSGSKNGNWKGGRTSKNRAARSKAAYHEWKAAVLANAEWKCSECGREHGHVCECCGHRILLHAHHIISFEHHPEKRYEPSNGKTLCERCHMTEHHKQIG